MPIKGVKEEQVKPIPDTPKLVVPGKGVLTAEEYKKIVDEQEKEKKKETETFGSLSYFDKKNKRLIEQIYKDDAFVFAVKDYTTGKIEFSDTIVIGNKRFYPEVTQAEPFRREKVILFPTDVTEYRSTESLLNACDIFIKKNWYANTFDYLISEYYLFHTWVYDKFSEVGYLNNLGPWGRGKTRWLDSVGGLCFRATSIGGVLTAASLFHIIDYSRGTTNIDEADFSSGETQTGIVKVLTYGNQANHPIVRCDTEGGPMISYNPYGPKLYSHRQQIQDPALRSRCNTIKAMSDKDSIISTNLDQDVFFAERQLLINKLLKWRFDHYLTTKLDPTIQGRLKVTEGRLKQIMIPMLSSLKMLDIEHKLAGYITVKNKEMTEDRKEDNHYRVFISILQLKSEQGNGLLKVPITVGNIVSRFNELYPNPNWALSPSWCGKLINGEELQLETKMNTAGQMQLVCTEEDIERLKTKYEVFQKSG
ncbi:hypothetical protein MUP77_16105 [Candidatus Bathyarchaeota archaeon]|nr:hypothetical protein [Candidatus Bathyarchaeota archaeon]